ncbi:MAG: DegT/DnrJ/EryC1/StrS family aminotransferase, partial [Dehalococcoidales bacterium]|nr:DegT/DnrJ/EryC1/StrS family aminotransferase [Dehalococcoidales bacterium]
AVIKKGGYWAIGPEIQEFEKKVCDYVGVKYAVAVNSGTSALHTLMAAHDIGKGDEVIVPAFTFIATANAPLFVGAKPVFAEVEGATYGLDPKDVEKKITKNTKAIMPIHYGGLPCRIEELRQIAKDRKVLLIEDAAGAIGASINGKRVGSFGESAILSFCAPKVVTTGEGGMILTNDDRAYEKAKLIINQGRADTGNYFATATPGDYVMLGYNFRMSTMTAALGLAQMSKLDDIIKMRNDNADYMIQKLAGTKQVIFPKVADGTVHVRQIHTARIVSGVESRDALCKYLGQQGVSSRVYWSPVHLTPFYKREFGYKEGYLPVTEKVASEVLTFPMYPTLTKDDMDYVARCTSDFFKSGGK